MNCACSCFLFMHWTSAKVLLVYCTALTICFIPEFRFAFYDTTLFQANILPFCLPLLSLFTLSHSHSLTHYSTRSYLLTYTFRIFRFFLLKPFLVQYISLLQHIFLSSNQIMFFNFFPCSSLITLPLLFLFFLKKPFCRFSCVFHPYFFTISLFFLLLKNPCFSSNFVPLTQFTDQISYCTVFYSTVPHFLLIHNVLLVFPLLPALILLLIFSFFSVFGAAIVPFVVLDRFTNTVLYPGL